MTETLSFVSHAAVQSSVHQMEAELQFYSSSLIPCLNTSFHLTAQYVV